MHIRSKLLLLLCLSSVMQIKAEETLQKDLFPFWQKALKEFNYTLPDELYEKYKHNKFKGGAYKTDKYTIYISPIFFPKEKINYGIYLRSNMVKNLDSNVYYMFYFFNNDLLMISLTNSYIDKLGRYEFANYIYRTGLTLEYENSYLKRVSCLHKPKEIDRAYKIEIKEYCGESILLDENQNISEVIDHKVQCVDICNRYLPFKDPGTYVITNNDVRLRKEPSTQGAIIGMLKRGIEVNLLEDSFKTEHFPNIDAATWAKIRLEDGTEGYVYGAFLRAPREPDIVLIKEKAEEWKKANKKK